MPITGVIADELREWTLANVKDEALDPQGRQDDLHITLAYGLPSDKRVVERVLRPVMRGIAGARTYITHATHFRHTQRSVLILQCSSGPLQRYTELCSRSFGVKYVLNAHITLAYIRTGREPRTSGLMQFVERMVQSDHLIYVDQSKTRHEIPFE